jgi:hypothetical protein
MYRNLLLWLCLLLAPLSTAMAKDKVPAAKESADKEPASKEPAAKELSGMSIVGNDEAPKALYIVPWKSSEIGMETSLSMMLTESDTPVDRDVFMRQLDFFEISTKK